MTAACAWELKNLLLGARVEKVQQPEKDEIVLLMHRDRTNRRLVLCASPASARVSITERQKESPLSAPMFCMQLRKHLGASRLTEIVQPDFERVLRFTFEGYDEMGFAAKRYLICEIMGKYSNVVLCDKNDKILGVLRPVDFSTSQKRQLLPGMTYHMPPSQDKTDPRSVTREAFCAAFSADAGEVSPDRFLLTRYRGLSPLTAREIAYEAGEPQNAERLWNAFSSAVKCLQNEAFVPVLLIQDGRPFEYSCLPVRQYGDSVTVRTYGTFGAMLDDFFAERDRVDRIRQHASDLIRLLGNAKARLEKKIHLQMHDLAECGHTEEYRKTGDLITANLYQISRGASEVTLTDYYSDELPQVTVRLNPRLTPSQNAQQYYKKYTKAQTAQRELTRQCELARNELLYLSTVEDALMRAVGEADLEQIRTELAQAGYGSHHAEKRRMKIPQSRPLRFLSSNGMTILCGRNNLQNDRLTFREASRFDYWFHVKNAPGSHVILQTDGKTPDNQSMTEAAVIAACYSSLSTGEKVPVDYTMVRNLKKPPASRPGFVTYSENLTAYVTPDTALAERLLQTR